MQYELMDIDTANVVGIFETEAEALAEVRALLRANGPEYACCLSLACVGEDEEDDAAIAEGDQLAALASAVGPPRTDSVRA